MIALKIILVLLAVLVLLLALAAAMVLLMLVTDRPEDGAKADPDAVMDYFNSTDNGQDTVI